MNEGENVEAEIDAPIESALWAEADEFLSSLMGRLPTMLDEHEEHEAGFRQRCYERWKEGLDLLKMMLVMSLEFGSTINERERPKAVEEQDHKFEAIIALHARAVRVSNEILTLLRNGYPDGALSRWRTLHEIAVVSTFLNANDEETSRKFLAHRGITTYKALRQYEEHLPRSNMTPLETGVMDEAKAWRDALLVEHGEEFGDEMGWAHSVLGKRRINLYDLEVATGLDHWRPRFKWASDDIHAGPKPYFAHLGMVETPTDKPVLLAGASNSGFTDPAHMCVISLNLANHAIPLDYLNKDDVLVLLAMRRLSDQIGDTFFSIDRETGEQSARRLQEKENARQKGDTGGR